jgi:CGNR zinc finger protein
MSVIMSQPPVNFALPVSLGFIPISGTWEQIEGIEDQEVAWEFIPEPTRSPAELDPWSVRKEFLELKHDQRAKLEEFLKSTGAFCWINDYRPLREEEIWVIQGILQKELLKPRAAAPARPSDDWSWSFADTIRKRISAYELNVVIRLQDGELVGLMQESTTLDAILCTIVVDRVRKFRFKICARSECGKIYELTSRHRRKYCSFDCAHLVAVRSSRARLERASSKRKLKRLPGSSTRAKTVQRAR